jgi:hypothetical protein
MNNLCTVVTLPKSRDVKYVFQNCNVKKFSCTRQEGIEGGAEVWLHSFLVSALDVVYAMEVTERE